MNFKTLLIWMLFFCLQGFAQAQIFQGEIVIKDLSDKIDLSGAWKFKEGDDPNWARADFPDRNWQIINVPESWTNQGIPPKSYGWYRLHLHIQENLKKTDSQDALSSSTQIAQSYSLLLEDIRSAGEIYLNGQKIYQVGVFSTQAENEIRIATKPHEIRLGALPAGEYVLAIRVSNHQLHFNVGLRHISLRSTESALKVLYTTMSIYLIIIGGFLIMAFSHFALYIGGKHEKSHLLYTQMALFCIFFTEGMVGVFSRLTQMDLYFVQINLLHLSVFVMPYLALAFLEEQFEFDWPWIKSYLLGTLLIYLAFVLVIQGDSYLENCSLYLGFSNVVLAIGVGLFLGLKALMNKQVGSQVMMFGYFFFMLSILLELGAYQQWFANTSHIPFVPIGCFILGITMSITLGQKFYSLNQRVLRQVSTLQELNETGEILAGLMDRQEVVEAIFSALSKQAGTRRCSLYLIRDEALFLFCTFPRLKIDSKHKRVKLGEGAIGTAAKIQQMIYLPDTQDDKSYPLPYPNNESCSLLCLPLLEDFQLLGVLTVSGRPKHFDLYLEDRKMIETISRFLTITLKNIQLLENTRDIARMEAELKTAAAVQHALFPASHPQPRGVQLSGYFKSATETGGDWYGYMQLDDYFFIMIGDVTGHGTAAALVTATARSTCSALQRMQMIHPELELTPAFILDQLNKAVYEVGDQKFLMTFFVARLDLRDGKLCYANAGHNFPLWKQNDGNIKSLVAKGPQLGRRLDAEFESEEAILQQGEAILFYTDGLIENNNRQGKELGLNFIRNLLKQNHQSSAQEIADLVSKEAFHFFDGNPIADDMTYVVLKVAEDFKPA